MSLDLYRLTAERVPRWLLHAALCHVNRGLGGARYVTVLGSSALQLQGRL